MQHTVTRSGFDERSLSPVTAREWPGSRDVADEHRFLRLDSQLATASARLLSPRTEACEGDDMSRLRRISPWNWVMLGALVVAGALLVSDFLVGWAPSWLLFVVLTVVFASNVLTVRMAWKQTDHPAFHPDPRNSGSRPPAPGESESDR